MNALLDLVVEKHGGLERWKGLSSVSARVTFGGPFWEFKGHADFANTVTVEASVQEEYVRQVDEVTGRTVVYDKKAERVTVAAADGGTVAELDNPRSTFDGFTPETPWDLAQIAYFRSYATWHYLLEPYLFTWAGAEVEEVEPRIENGETWRVLSVTFPDSVDAHNATQRYYYDSALLLRRMDYQPEVNGRPPVAHYIRKYETFDGIVVPTVRHVLSRNEDMTPDLSWIPITLEVGDVSFR
ncbi:hypothetical protein [Streptomyces fructofermentans]|uniref:Uncharacterized protein n=1 Tax=Streptomyces fructofermentans TaxID=152141 RepID=A0A918KWD7_9ACTN|nr:hypothetical protein [Streptomyces fructofermentans]GGX76630.1 hypothetical protein GCM10010515_50670 [Streptomyces fructofermentans]